MNISTLLAVGSYFETQVLPILRTVFFFISVACGIVLIVTTLLQANNSSEGLDGFGGVQETYYAKNKGASRDGRLRIITIVVSIVMILCIIAFFVSKLFSAN